MKVVLFCGGLGTRLREHSDTIPKPLVDIGYRPILWHIMRYYAHFGHKDFILCLGYRGDMIKQYFRTYDECISNDFVMTQGGRHVELLGNDISDWRITFVDTGIRTNIGSRLRAVRKHLENEDLFLANYSDAVTNVDLNAYQKAFLDSGATAGLLAVHPVQSLHALEVGPDSLVKTIRPSSEMGVWINGGYFFFTPEIFEELGDGEELVEGPFRRLASAGDLFAYRYRGFWDCIDTYKDKKRFDSRFESGDLPWAIWNGNGRKTGEGDA